MLIDLRSRCCVLVKFDVSKILDHLSATVLVSCLVHKQDVGASFVPCNNTPKRQTGHTQLKAEKTEARKQPGSPNTPSSTSMSR